MPGVLLVVAAFAALNALVTALLRARGAGLISFARSVPAGRWRAPAARLVLPLAVYLIAVLVFAGHFRASGLLSSKVEVVPGFPAQAAGLETGDQVVEVKGAPVRTFDQVLESVQATGPGQSMDVVVLRGERRIPLQVTTDAQGRVGLRPSGELARRSWGQVAVVALMAPFRVAATLASDVWSILLKGMESTTVAGPEALLVPAPMSVENTAFRPAANQQIDNMDPARFGLFDFEPAEKLDVARVAAALDEATRKVGMIHGMVFPEEALTPGELDRLTRVLLARKDRSPRFIVAGVRGARLNTAELVIRYKSGWRSWRQNKHHRWRLDESQIRTYELTSSLHPKVRWWENIDVTQRQLQFVTVNGWLTFCHLICEDLARQDPVAQSVRAVGPTLVVALLQDGPQLKSRWPARYAGVLADDPGSSVLTLTSLGMAMRSRPAGHPPCRVIALWKDPQQGEREITLEEGSSAVVLTTCADKNVVEWTADGRTCGGTSAQLTFGSYEQVRVSPAAATRAPRRRRARLASRPRPSP